MHPALSGAEEAAHTPAARCSTTSQTNILKGALSNHNVQSPDRNPLPSTVQTRPAKDTASSSPVLCLTVQQRQAHVLASLTSLGVPG
jgi:hypothetical protein